MLTQIASRLTEILECVYHTILSKTKHLELNIFFTSLFNTAFRLTCVLSRIQLLVTPWTVAYHTPLTMEFSGKNPGVGCHFLLHLDQQCCCFSHLFSYEIIDNWHWLSNLLKWKTSGFILFLHIFAFLSPHILFVYT